MKVTFFGAVRGVTGSKHLVEILNPTQNSQKTTNILLDCGMFQGHRRQARELNSKLPFVASEISAVILSHAHLDHSGMLPVLVKNGFSGPIYCTPATRDITEYILLDSAHLQIQDAEYMNKHKIEGKELAEPLYTLTDVTKTMSQFITVPYGLWHELNSEIKFKFYNAGHILGSAITVLQAQEIIGQSVLAYTGDVGRQNTPLLKDPELIQENVPTIITESTYGGRQHGTVEEAKVILKDIVNRVAKREGKIIIPSFALGRTQEIIYLLHELNKEKSIPPLPIFIDSPLGVRMSEIVAKYEEDYDLPTKQTFLTKGELPLIFENLKYVRTVEESKQLNSLNIPCVIISSSGMCEGGRILHHLINSITNPKNAILITGYQAEHTLGRRLVDGETKVKIFNSYYQVAAEVLVLNELSAHAGKDELADYLQQVNGLKNIYLVHGESNQTNLFSDYLKQLQSAWQVQIPSQNETINV